MNNQMGPAPSPNAQPQTNAPEENQESSPTDAIGEVGKALMAVSDAIQGAKAVPPEAQKLISSAANQYMQGISILGKSMGVSMPDAEQEQQKMGNQPAESMGRSGAVAADMPSGKGIRAIPA